MIQHLGKWTGCEQTLWAPTGCTHPVAERQGGAKSAKSSREGKQLHEGFHSGLPKYGIGTRSFSMRPFEGYLCSQPSQPGQNNKHRIRSLDMKITQETSEGLLPSLDWPLIRVRAIIACLVSAQYIHKEVPEREHADFGNAAQVANLRHGLGFRVRRCGIHALSSTIPQERVPPAPDYRNKDIAPESSRGRRPNCDHCEGDEDDYKERGPDLGREHGSESSHFQGRGSGRIFTPFVCSDELCIVHGLVDVLALNLGDSLEHLATF